jgi:8-oxo-dGTP diphosphatase
MLLLVRRVGNPEKGRWCLPAGYLDAGDDPRAAAAREALEETSLQVAVEELVDVYYNPPAEGGATVFLLYRAHILGGSLQAADDAVEAGFFPLDALPDLAFASTRDAVRRLRG